MTAYRRRKLHFRTCGYVLAAAIALLGSGRIAAAVEGGAGWYLLGSKGSLAGILPPPGLFYTNDLYWYSGDANASRQFPTQGGQLALGISADAFVSVNTALYVAPAPFFGGRVAFGVVLPVVSKSVDVGARLSQGGLPLAGASLSDSVTAIGDPLLVAAQGWDSGYWHATIFNLVNIPIGQWEEGALANAGFNRWGYDLTAAVTWFDTENGHEITVAPGFTVNGENLTTGYRSGTEFHVEFAAMQHFSPQFALGVSGYYYNQFGADSGSAAGPFKGEAFALGPAIDLNFNLGKLPVSLKAKYLHEFDTTNRLQGNAGFIQLAIPLWVPGPEPEELNVPDPL
jgi:hypothetical protein